MNIYDTANRLAQEMRESEEYKNYKKLKDSIESNPDKKAKLEEFENMRYEMQLGTIKGTENEEENKEKLKQSVGIKFIKFYILRFFFLKRGKIWSTYV